MDTSVFKSLYDSRIAQRDIGDIVRDYAQGIYFKPAVQREMGYNTRQKSLVVLSILRGLSIDSITLVAQDAEGEKFSVCDGAHRLQALLEFFNGEFSLNFPANEGPDAGSIRGKYYEQLDRAAQLKLRTTQLVCVKLFPPGYTRAEIILAESRVLRAKNSCAVRMSRPVLKLTDWMARDEAFAAFKQQFYSVLRGLLPELGFTFAGHYINKSVTAELAVVCADLRSPKLLLAALQEPDVRRGIFDVCVANGLHGGQGGSGANMAIYVRVMFAVFTLVIPELDGRYREIVSEYLRLKRKQSDHTLRVVQRVMSRLLGTRDWHYCVGM